MMMQFIIEVIYISHYYELMHSYRSENAHRSIIACFTQLFIMCCSILIYLI